MLGILCGFSVKSFIFQVGKMGIGIVSDQQTVLSENAEKPVTRSNKALQTILEKFSKAKECRIAGCESNGEEIFLSDGTEKLEVTSLGQLDNEKDINGNYCHVVHESQQEEFSIFEDGFGIQYPVIDQLKGEDYGGWKCYLKAFEYDEKLKPFTKKFTLEQSFVKWELPEESKIYVTQKWKIQEFMDLKSKLNQVKDKLDNYETDKWHYHTRVMNRAGLVTSNVRKEVQPDLYNLDWCKFYEICSTFDLVPKRAKENSALNSLHLCEEPGCFIAALNHYLKSNYSRLKWFWLATSYNPYYEGNAPEDLMNDDRLIFNTLNHWIFGDDYTGDVTNVDNMIYLIEKCGKLKPILLIVADGSKSCMSDPNEQELIVSRLTFYEVATALFILAEGGNFVVKMFTIFEEETICMMYLLACSFQSVSVFKPAASKEGNSEVFVVCLNYKRCKTILSAVQKILEEYESNRETRAMFSFNCIPKDFLRSLHKCSEKFKNEQVEVIERNIRTYQNYSQKEVERKTRFLKQAVAAEYIKRFKLRSIKLEDQILYGKKIDKGRLFLMKDIEMVYEKDSLNKRLTSGKKEQFAKLPKFLAAVEELSIDWTDQGLIWSFSFPLFCDAFKMVIGKPIKIVKSSKFCLTKLLKARNDILKIAENLFDMNVEDFFIAEEQPTKSLSRGMEKIIKEIEPELITSGETFVLNFNALLWNALDSGYYDEYEKSAFRKIARAMNKMDKNQNLIIEGYPVLTQFTAGMIYLLGHSFEKVGFVRGSKGNFGIIFYTFRKKQYCYWNYSKSINEKMKTLNGSDNKTVLSVLPITELVGENEDFFLCITAANNLSIQEQIRRMIHRMLEKVSPVD